MAGRRVECVECGERFRIPDDPPDWESDEGFSSNEWVMFALLFFLIPAANVFVSSILYYVWKKSHPRRSSHINALGFIVFGIHFVLGLVILVILNEMRK